MVTVELTKYFTRGLLQGETITEIMQFVDEERAYSWFEGVNKNHDRGHVDYQVVDMKFIVNDSEHLTLEEWKDSYNKGYIEEK